MYISDLRTTTDLNVKCIMLWTDWTFRKFSAVNPGNPVLTMQRIVSLLMSRNKERKRSTCSSPSLSVNTDRQYEAAVLR